MPNKTEETNSAEPSRSQMNFNEFIGRIVGGFVGVCIGISLGVFVGGSISPIIGSIAGFFMGVIVSDRIFKIFPRLASAQTISIAAAGYGISGLIIGLFIGDAVGTFSSLDRMYSSLIGASLGLYVGVLLGYARK